MNKQITIKDLLANKEQLKKKNAEKETLYIKSLAGNITIIEPSKALCMEVIEMAQDNARSDKADAYMVYNCVVEPNLKDAGLQKEFGCVEPTDIVDILFKSGETASITGHCLQLAGYGRGLKKVDNDLKN